MKKSTLCFCVQDNKVLLGMKKAGFGAGKWNGYGGKVLDTEDSRVAAVRELTEESGLVTVPAHLDQVAIVDFWFEENHVFTCFVYITTSWQGTPVETAEMRPQWFEINSLPFAEMWAADAKWLPIILSGKKIKAKVVFNTDGSVVKEFDYEPAKPN